MRLLLCINVAITFVQFPKNISKTFIIVNYNIIVETVQS